MSLDRLAAALSDRYAIDRGLGAGGMATVYLAEDLKHHRRVAIKVLRLELAAVTITMALQMSIGRPTRIAGAPDGVVGVSSAPDGRLLLLHNAKRNPVPLTVIAHWRSKLARK